MTASPFLYSAEELFAWLGDKPDFVLLDVRNEKDHANWYIEAPSLFPYINVPYYNFLEDEQKSLDLIPPGEKIRIVCAKEGSARYIADLLSAHDFADVGYLAGGIVAWGNLLAPRLVNEAGDYRLYQVIRPGKASCSYLLTAGAEAMVFDPTRNIDFYQKFAATQGAKIVRIFETHRQADYISGAVKLHTETNAPISAHGHDFDGAHFAYEPLADQQVFSLAGEVEVMALHTPGHTLGSTSYLIGGKYLLSGDTVFINTAGRPDLGGKSSEWSRILYLTLTLRLRQLDDAVQILPGHYTTWQEADENGIFMAELGKLRKENVAFHLPSERKFAEFIEENLRPQPDVYAQIRRVNGGWLKVSEDEANVMDLGKNECGASNYGKVGVSAEVLRSKRPA